jgi:hypothetical protein
LTVTAGDESAGHEDAGDDRVKVAGEPLEIEAG